MDIHNIQKQIKKSQKSDNSIYRKIIKKNIIYI